jgi:hypothetical protein
MSSFLKCMLDLANGVKGFEGMVDVSYEPATNLSQLVGIPYDTCHSKCGDGVMPASWPDASLTFTGWLLPWIALVAQMPFQQSLVEDLTAACLIVGSPVLALFSLLSTASDLLWVERYRKKFIASARTCNPNFDAETVTQVTGVLTACYQLPFEILNFEVLEYSLTQGTCWERACRLLRAVSRTMNYPLAAQFGIALITYGFSINSLWETPPSKNYSC